MPSATDTATKAMKARENKKINKYKDRIKPRPGYPPFDSAPIDFMPLVGGTTRLLSWSSYSAGSAIRTPTSLFHLRTFLTSAWHILSVTLQQLTTTFHARYERLVSPPTARMTPITLDFLASSMIPSFDQFFSSSLSLSSVSLSHLEIIVAGDDEIE